MNEIAIQENIPETSPKVPTRPTRSLVFRDYRMILSCPFLTDDDVFTGPKGESYRGKAGDFLVILDYAHYLVIDSRSYDLLFKQNQTRI